MIAEKYVKCLDYDLGAVHKTTENSAISAICYCEHNNSILTAAGRSVTVRASPVMLTHKAREHKLGWESSFKPLLRRYSRV